MRTCSGAVIGALAAAVLAAPALADGYMTINGVSVPPADTSDPGWMKVVSYSIASLTSSGSTATITRNQDGVSPALFTAAATGKVFQFVALDVPAADGSQIVYRFEQVRITSDQASSGPGGAPQETLKLAFHLMQELDKSAPIQVNGAILQIPALASTIARSTVLTTPSATTPASGKPTLTEPVRSPWAN